MFVHSVYFRLRPDLTASQRRTFLDGLRDLSEIDTVQVAFIGTPAATDRTIVDRNYTHALVLAFEDDAGHDAYQTDPVHDAFRKNCGGFWSDLRIFDCVTE
jgi:hypothetical protein